MVFPAKACPRESMSSQKRGRGRESISSGKRFLLPAFAGACFAGMTISRM